ncbi:MAG: DNA pilot protein [Microvirus sp.]|nr:MAG: DNA pilot protein [Microvirus sp.]
MPFPIAAVASALSSAAGAGMNFLGAKNDIKMQKDFAQHGIAWKVRDAKAAGVHPLYALGANTMSFSPVGVGGAGNNIADMGADIARAVDAGASQPERNARLSQLTTDRVSLENDLLRLQILEANKQVAGSPPAVPSIAKSDYQGGAAGEAIMKTPPVLNYPVRNPDNSVTYFKVQNPNMGDNMEQHYSDAGGNVVGGSSAMQDFLTWLGYK